LLAKGEGRLGALGVFVLAGLAPAVVCVGLVPVVVCVGLVPAVVCVGFEVGVGSVLVGLGTHFARCQCRGKLHSFQVEHFSLPLYTYDLRDLIAVVVHI